MQKLLEHVKGRKVSAYGIPPGSMSALVVAVDHANDTSIALYLKHEMPNGTTGILSVELAEFFTA